MKQRFDPLASQHQRTVHDVACATARAQLAQIPKIVLDYPGVSSEFPAEVRFTTAIYGVHQPGVAYRMDEVPIPLRAFFRSPLPPDEVVLKALTAKLPRQCW